MQAVAHVHDYLGNSTRALLPLPLLGVGGSAGGVVGGNITEAVPFDILLCLRLDRRDDPVLMMERCMAWSRSRLVSGELPS